MILHQGRGAAFGRVCLGLCAVTQAFQINRCRLLQEVIGIDSFAMFLLHPVEQRFTGAKADRASRADIGAGGSEVSSPAFGTQIALDCMVLLGVIADCSVRAGQRAFTATGAAVFIDCDDAGNRVLGDCFRVYRAGTQASRAFTLLAGNGQEIEPGW